MLTDPLLLAFSGGLIPTILWLLLPVLIVGVLMYAAGPLLIYCTVRFNSGDVYEEIDIEEVRPKAHAYFAQVGDQFVGMGFQPWLVLRLRDFVKGPNAGHVVAMVFANRQVRTLALVAAIFQPTTTGERILFQADYSSDTADGMEFNTTNARAIAESTSDPKVVLAHARGLSDLHRLLSIHRQLLAGRPLRELPGEEELIAVLNEQTREKLKRKASAGYITLCGDRIHYRPTLAGAFLMCWRVLPPGSWLYWSRHASRIKQLERAAGISGAA